MVFSTVEGGEAGGSILSPSLLSVSLKMSGLDLETKKIGFLSPPKIAKVGPPCHLGTLMRSGQFCSGGTTLADCWLSKEDQRDSLGGKSPEKFCQVGELLERTAPWSEEAEEDKDNREEVA